MKSTYTSDELFHFVGRHSPSDDEANYAILVKILKDGCVSYAPHERGWGTVRVRVDPSRNLLSDDLVVPAVTCFCDIPFDHLPIHAQKYGRFGLSFRRDYLSKYGARPVLYVPYVSPDAYEHPLVGRTLLNKIEWTYRWFHDTDEGNRIREQVGSVDVHDVFLKDFIAYIKPFVSNLSDDDANNFYLEREWRKYGNLMFTSAQVLTIVVGPGFEDKLRKDVPEYASIVRSCPL